MTIDYIGGFEYHPSTRAMLISNLLRASDQVFAAYVHPQGRIAPGEAGINCEYFLKDHLGCVRVIYADIDRDEVVDFNEEEW